MLIARVKGTPMAWIPRPRQQPVRKNVNIVTRLIIETSGINSIATSLLTVSSADAAVSDGEVMNCSMI